MGGFGFREAAEFWGVAGDPELAFRLHALIGGAAEDRARCGGGGPGTRAEFDRWVEKWLLSPDSAMFGAGARLQAGAASSEPTSAARAADPEPGDSVPTALTQVVGAISAGNARPGQIASAVGRSRGEVDALLAELAAKGLVERLADPLGGEPGCVIVAPIVRLHHLVIAPNAAALAGGQAERVWAESQAIVAEWVYRPHFASLARQWCLRHAAEATIGGVARGARPVAIACHDHGEAHGLEALVVEDPVAAGRVLAIGATNAPDAPMDVRQLRWLAHLRELLPADRADQRRPPRLLLFSRSGFTDELTAMSGARGDLELVDLDRVYRGA